MNAVPRPITDLTHEQRRLLEIAVESVKNLREATRRAWDDAIAARTAGVPDGLLCEQTGLSRATLNRRFGPRRQAH